MIDEEYDRHFMPGDLIQYLHSYSLARELGQKYYIGVVLQVKNTKPSHTEYRKKMLTVLWSNPPRIEHVRVSSVSRINRINGNS
jgi:hypothetical protein